MTSSHLYQQEEQKLLYELSRLEHEQWISWAQKIMNQESLTLETRERWKSYFVDYDLLTQPVKEQDMFFAQKSLELFKKFLSQRKNL